MLVDDEYAVRKYVTDRINWSQYDFEIVCEAENGNEAYELFEQYLPDVVITDIKMPFMNGLELAEKILEKYPYTKIIILTGFDEFEYAKKSIELHVMNYVLKPISSKSLIKILKEVKVKLDEEIINKRNSERLKDFYEKSYPLLRDKFLEDFVKGEYIEAEVEEWLRYYNIPLKGDFYLVAIIQIDHFYRDRQAINTKDTEFKKLVLLEIVEEVNKKEDLGIYFLSNNQIVVIAYGEAYSEGEFVQGVTRKLEMIRQGIEKFQTFTITIGIGHVCRSLTNIPSSRKSALNVHDYKVILGNNQIIYIDDVEPRQEAIQEIDLEFNEIVERKVTRMLKSGAIKEFSEYLEKVFNHIALNPEKVNENQLYLFELITQIITTSKELKVDLTKIENAELNLFELMKENQDLDNIKSTILLLANFVMETGTSTRLLSTANLVNLAKEYVKKEYKDWDLNIQKISEYLNYSPNYFSTVFKKETGISFMNYLMDVRLEEAKELLLTTELKSLEIALEVGFSSSNYFAYCFKKRLNISPTLYRKKNRIN